MENTFENENELMSVVMDEKEMHEGDEMNETDLTQDEDEAGEELDEEESEELDSEDTGSEDEAA